MKANLRFGRPLAAIAAAAVVFAAGASHAADAIMDIPQAPAAPIQDLPGVASWAGGYAGVTAGYGFAGRANTPGNTINTRGWNGGAFGGWQGQDGMLVYGVEADVGYNGNRGSNAGAAARTSVDGSVRARIGVAATDNILVYGTAGGAAARARVSDAVGSDTNTLLGYTIGAGVDVKVTEQVFARGEYRYTDYGAKTFNTGGPATGRTDTRENKVMLGLGVRF